MGWIVYSFAESSTFKLMNQPAFVKGKRVDAVGVEASCDIATALRIE